MRHAACAALGADGVDLVMAWLKHRGRVYDGRIVRTDQGRIAKGLQATVGDVLFNSDALTVRSIEVKTEQRTTGNLFLETYSNATAEEGRLKDGWLWTSGADFLFYYFSDTDTLHAIDLPALKRWAFRAVRKDGTLGRIYDFREVEQRSNEQLNRTLGRLVPVAVLQAEVGFRTWHPAEEITRGAMVRVASAEPSRPMDGRR